MHRVETYEELFDELGVRAELHPILTFLHERYLAAGSDLTSVAAKILKAVDFKRARVMPSAVDLPATIITAGVPKEVRNVPDYVQKLENVLASEMSVALQKTVDKAHAQYRDYTVYIQWLPSSLLLMTEKEFEPKMVMRANFISLEHTN